MCELSIIIPVYNTEKYIRRCLDSIVELESISYEIIIVDDGSTDNSYDAIKSYVDNYMFISCFRTKNYGLSAARNFGYRKSSGKFILFVDSDDYVDAYVLKNMFFRMLELESDVIVGATSQVKNNIIINSHHPIQLLEQIKGSEFLLLSLKSQRYFSSVWSYIIKRDLIDRYNLLFVDGKYHEDEEFSLKIFFYARFVSVWDDIFYFCDQRFGSITRNRENTQQSFDLLEISSMMMNFINSVDMDSKLYLFLSDYIIGLYLSGFYKGSLYRYRIIPNRKLLNSKCFLKNRIKILIFNFNPRFYCLLNGIYKFIGKIVDFLK